MEVHINLSDAIDKIRPSVAQISIEFDSPHKIIQLGSGVLLEESGYVLTAKHVIAEGATHIEQRGNDGDFLVSFAFPNSAAGSGITMRGAFHGYETDLIDEDPVHDLALLHLADFLLDDHRSQISFGGRQLLAATAVAPTTTERPREGSQVATSGYPLEAPVMYTSSGTLATSWGFQISTPESGQPLQMFESYIADMPMHEGNSGGPVFLAETAEVIGVCSNFQVGSGTTFGGERFLYNSGLTAVIPIQYGLALLSRHL